MPSTTVSSTDVASYILTKERNSTGYITQEHVTEEHVTEEHVTQEHVTQE